MRNRIRIQPYVSADLRRRLAAYAAAQDVTESAIAEAALTKYLEPNRDDEALVVRRLDAVVQVLGRVEERLDIVGEAVGRFVRLWLRITPPAVSDEDKERGDGLYRALVGSISRAIGTETTLVAAVRRARLPPPVAAPGSVTQGGR